MIGPSQHGRVLLAAAALIAAGAAALTAQPAVFATGEGQIGRTPPAPSEDRVHAPDFAPVTIPGLPLFEGDLALGRIFQDGGLLPDPPALTVVEDRLHSGIFAAILRDSVAGSFAVVDKVAPSVEPWLSESDVVVGSFARDGTTSGTMKVELKTYDLGDGTIVAVLELEVPFDVPLPFEELSGTDTAVDEQNRATTVFTEVSGMVAPKVKAQTWDAELSDLTDLFDVNTSGIDPDVALLDPKGDRLVVSSVSLGSPPAIQGNFVDVDDLGLGVSGPDFGISTTVPPAMAGGNLRPAVAADPVTGRFTVCWDHVTGVSGNPADIRARAYDPEGIPEGDDFQVNVPPLIGDDGAQGQCDVAYGPGGLRVIVWATDGATGDPDLDIRGRAYLPDGSPITGGNLLTLGQFAVNTGSTPGGPLSDRQDWPRARFLPEPDASGRPQFAVVWRDVGEGDGSDPNGTGTTARCFSIDGLEDVPIFEDGFESGDTSSWSASTP